MNNSDIQKQLAKLRKDKRILWFGILFFVLVMMWILLSIFATTKTSSVSAEQRQLAKPFIPRLESKSFEEILQKRSFTQEELGAFPIYALDEKNMEKGLSTTPAIVDVTKVSISNAIKQQSAPASSSATSSSANPSTETPTE